MAQGEALLPLLSEAERAVAAARATAEAVEGARASLTAATKAVDAAKQRRTQTEQLLMRARLDAAGAAEAHEVAVAAQRRLQAAIDLPAAQLRESTVRAQAAAVREPG